MLTERLGAIWERYGKETCGTVLIGHSIGGAISTIITSEPGDLPILVVAVSGVGLRTPAEHKPLWDQLPNTPTVDMPPPLKDQLMFGPAGSFDTAMPAASYAANAPAPRGELVDIVSTWHNNVHAVLSKIKIPIHYRQGEMDHLWIVSQSEVDGFARACSNAPRVDAAMTAALGVGLLLATQAFAEPYFVEFNGNPSLTFQNGTFSANTISGCSDGFYNYARDTFAKAYNGCGQNGEYILFDTPISLVSMEVATNSLFPVPSDNLTVSLYDHQSNFLISQLTALANDHYQLLTFNTENVSKIVFAFSGGLTDFFDNSTPIHSDAPAAWYELKDIIYLGGTNPGLTQGGGISTPCFAGDDDDRICPPPLNPIPAPLPASLALLGLGLLGIGATRRRLN